ncbi:MAG TPA: hypothetical protein VFW00_14355 [Rhodocyclaceae bacterium]|nr:hypothetical protein [Rhodocyclaceae bacterium]
MRKIPLLPIIALICLGSVAQAADKPVYQFDYENAFRSPRVTSVLDPAIRIVWDERNLPEYVDRTQPDDYTRSSLIVSYLDYSGPPTDTCMKAFANVLEAMQQDARKQEYNVIFLHGDNSAAGNDKKQFSCRQGVGTDEVQLISEFMASKDFAAKISANPPEAIKPPPRKPSDNVLTFSLAPMLDDPNVKALLSTSFALHWGSRNPPAYTKRHGFEDFRGEESAKQSIELGCKAAFVSALKDMIESARDDGYNGVMRIHSDLDDQPAPDESLFECRVKHRDADVVLTGMMIVSK